MTETPSMPFQEDAVDRLKQTCADVPRRVAAAARRVEAGTAEDPWAAIRSSLVQLADVVQLTVNRLDHLVTEAQKLGKNGWPLDPSMNANELAWIVDASAEAEYDEVFATLYDHDNCSRLHELFAQLVNSPTLTQWQPIIVQAQDAIERAQYALLIPALLTVLEGAMFRSQTKSTNVKKHARRILESQDQTSVERIVWQTVVDFLDELYAKSDFTTAEPRLNRHWVLHGRAVVNWNRHDAIRLLHSIHTIDTINAAAAQLSLP